LETESIEAALKSAVESIRKTPAVRRRKNVSYAVVAKVGFDEIQKLSNDGYSYDIICKMLTENGALDAGANPKYLSRAFLRETKRRLSQTQVNAPNRGEGKAYTSAGKVDSTVAAPNKAIQNKVGEANKELEKKMPDRVVNTGLGRIIKNSDGSFDILSED